MIAKIAISLRWALAALFVYAGASKALDPKSFAMAVENYRLLSHVAAIAVAIYLPWLEIACGLGLLSRKLRMGTLGILAGLSLVFALALGLALARGLNIDCGCFTSSENPSGANALAISLARSVLLTLVCGWLAWHERGKTDAI